MKTVVDQLRAEIRKAEKRGITRYRLAKLSGLTQGMLSRLVNDKRNDPRVSTVKRLAEALEMELRLVKPE